MKEARGLLKFFKMLSVEAHVENGLVYYAMQDRKVARFGGGSQPGQHEMSLPELKLLWNLPEPWILKELRQEVLGEHSSVAKRSHRGHAASR